MKVVRSIRSGRTWHTTPALQIQQLADAANTLAARCIRNHALGATRTLLRQPTFANCAGGAFEARLARGVQTPSVRAALTVAARIGKRERRTRHVLGMTHDGAGTIRNLAGGTFTTAHRTISWAERAARTQRAASRTRCGRGARPAGNALTVTMEEIALTIKTWIAIRAFTLAACLECGTASHRRGALRTMRAFRRIARGRVKPGFTLAAIRAKVRHLRAGAAARAFGGQVARRGAALARAARDRAGRRGKRARCADAAQVTVDGALDWLEGARLARLA